MKLHTLGLLVIASTLGLAGCNVTPSSSEGGDNTPIIDTRNARQVADDLEVLLKKHYHEVFVTPGDDKDFLIYFSEEYTVRSALEDVMGHMPDNLSVYQDIAERTYQDSSTGYGITYKVKNGDVLIDMYSKIDEDDPYGPYYVIIDTQDIE